MEESRLDRLEKELNDLKTDIQSNNAKKESDKLPKKEKKPRAASEYNTFIKNHITEQKQKLGSDYNHKAAFKSGAEAWSLKKKQSG